MLKLAQKIFGSSNDRELKRLSASIAPINALEPEFEKLSDTELKAKTDEFRKRLQDGETHEDIMSELKF